MKKTALIILSLALAGGLFAEEAVTPLAGGLPLSAGPLSDPVAFPGKTGGLYLIGIGTGKLQAFYSADNGATFASAGIDYNGRNISAVRKLTLYERFFNDYLAFFIGADGADEGLYALAETSAGRLQVLSGRFDDPSAIGSISAYDVRAEHRQAFLAASLKVGRLSIIPVAENGVIQSAVQVSRSGESALSFEIRDKMSRGSLTHWGAFLSERPGQKVLVFFSIKDDGVESCVDAATIPGLEEVASYEVARDRTDGYYVVYSRNGNIFAARIRNGRSETLNAGGALNEGSPDATLVAAVSGDNGVSVVYRCVDAGKAGLYEANIASEIDTGAAIESRRMSRGSVADAIKLFPYGVDRHLLGFFEETNGRRMLRVFEKSSFSGYWQDVPGAGRFPGAIQDFSFKVLSDGTAALEILSLRRQKLTSAFHKLEQNGDDFALLWEYVYENAVSQADYALFSSGDSLVRIVGGNTFILNALLRKGVMISGDRPMEIAASAGIHFLQAGDGKWYRLAADEPAPPPALWTCGYALQSALGLCRLYVTEDEVRGGFKAEIQRVGYEAPVWWGDEYGGDGGEYMRSFPLKAGETRDLTVEAWDVEKRVGVYAGKVKGEKSPAQSTSQANGIPTRAGALGGGETASGLPGPGMQNLGAPGDYPPVVTAGTGFTVYQLTNNTTTENGPQTDNGMAVWAGQVGSDYEIFFWRDGLSAAVQITDNNLVDGSPQIDNGVVVWQGYDGHDYEIYMWRENSTPLQITNNEYDDMYPCINNDTIVWQGYDGTDYEIFYRVINQDSSVQLTNNQFNDITPKIDNNMIAWCGYDGTDYEIFYWDEQSVSPVQITNNSFSDQTLDINNGIIVWHGYEPDDPEIFYWRKPFAAPLKVTNNTYKDYGPKINNGTVVWYGEYYKYEIFCWREGMAAPVIASASSKSVDDQYPTVSNGIIAWQGWDAENQDTEIYFRYMGFDAINRATNNMYDDNFPKINGGSIVWEGMRNQGYWEIYLLRFDIVPPAIDIAKDGTAGKDVWFTSSVTCTASATDGSQPEVSAIGVNEGSWHFWTTGSEVREGTGVDASHVTIGTEGTTTINFYVEDKLGNNNTATTTVNIDTSDPVINVIWDQSKWAIGSDTIVFEVIDPCSGINESTLRCSLYNNPGQMIPIHTNAAGRRYVAVNEIPVDGNILLNLYVEDNAGRSKNVVLNLKIDKVLPVIDVTCEQKSLSPGIEYWHNHAIQLVANVTDGGSGIDPASIRYVTSGLNALSGNGNQVTIPEMNEGKTYVTFFAKDLAGNETSKTVTVGVDRTPPTLRLSDITDVSAAELTQAIENEVFYARDNVSVIAAQQSITATNTTVTDGAVVVFSSGGTVEIVPEFTVETGADFTVNVGRLSNDVWIRDPAYVVTATAEDQAELSGLKPDPYSFEVLSESGIKEQSGSVNAAGSFAHGIHKVVFTVSDNAGNTTTASCLVKMDTSKPQIALPPSNCQFIAARNGYYSTNDEFGVSATDSGSGLDLDSWHWQVTGGPEGNGTSAVLTGLLDGAYAITYTANDKAGNQQSQPFTINIDRTPPEIVVTVYKNPQQGTATVTATITGPDALAPTGFKGAGVDSTAWAWQKVGETVWHEGEGCNSVTLTESATIIFRATDRLGNVGEKQSEPVLIDSTPPLVAPRIITAGVSEGTWTNASLIELTADCSDPESGIMPGSLQYSLDGINFQNCINDIATVAYTGSGTVTFNVTFRVKNGLGFEGASGPIQLKIDHAKPQIVINASPIGPEVGGWARGVRVSASAVDVDAQGNPAAGVNEASWLYSLNGGVWTSGSAVDVSGDGATVVGFRVQDNVTNGASASATVYVDRTGPVISITAAANSTAGGTQLRLALNSAVDARVPVDASSFAYCFDNSGNYVGLPSSFVGTPVYVDTSLLSPGAHTLMVRAADALGNEGHSAEAVFNVDREGPVITGVTVVDAKGVVGENEYTGYPSVKVQVAAADSGGAGGIAGIEYLLLDSYDPNPSFTGSTYVTGTEFNLTGLSNGVHYLYLRAVDLSENRSGVFIRIIRCDTSVPAGPQIKSLTHPKASTPQDAVALRDAVFELVPAQSGAGGTVGFAYVLYQGENQRERGETKQTTIAFVGLPDNEKDEYYRLQVSAVGASGKRSMASEYQFRIDSMPPEKLKVQASPHVDPTAYYNYQRTTFGWERPVDMTGVKSYYYLISAISIVLPVTDEEKAAFSLAGWQSTQALSIESDLSLVAGNAKWGTVYCAVCAEDFAGNRQFAACSAQFDIEKPLLAKVFGQEDEIKVDVDLANRKATVTRGAPGDQGSGVALVKAQVIEKSLLGVSDAWMILDPETGQFAVEGLDPLVTYVASIKVQDQAGNVSSYYQAFNLTAGETALGDVSIEFEETISGFRIHGVKSTIPADIKVYLTIPPALKIWAVDQQSGAETAVTELLFQTVNFAGEDFERGACDAADRFKLEVAGFTVHATGLGFTRTSGLSFASVSYTRLTDGDELKTFDYRPVTLSFPPVFVFRQSGSDAVTPPFDFTTRYTADGQENAGWQFTDAFPTRLSESYWVLEAASVQTAAINAYRMVGEDKLTSLPVTEARIDAADHLFEAPVSGGFNLYQEENLFNVKRALFRNDRLLILEADLIFKEGVSTETLALANFSIDAKGRIQEEAGFKAVGLTRYTSPDGKVYLIESVGFLGNKLVVKKGTLQFGAGQTIAFSDMIITENGLDTAAGASVPEFRANVHGFTIYSTSVRLMPEGVLCNTALLENFIFTRTVSPDPSVDNLGIRLEDNSVYRAGTGAGGFTIESAYGKPVNVQGLVMNETGLFAATASIPLPETMGTESVTVPNLPLKSDGTCGVSGEAAASVNLTMHQFAFTGDGARFDGAQIAFTSVSGNLGESVTPAPVVFAGLSLDGTGITNAGVCGNDVTYTTLGWNFKLTGLTVDGEGVHGNAAAMLPYALGGRQIVFPSFELEAGGGFTSGAADGSFSIRLFGWKVELSEIAFESVTIDGIEELILSAGKAVVQLYSTMGYATLEIEPLKLRWDGSVAAGTGGGSVEKEFLSTNGFKVVTNGYTFTADGLRLNGRVHFPSGLGDSYADYENWEIALDKDGVITTPSSSQSVTYKVANFDVVASNFWFDREGLTIQSNLFTVNLMVQTFSFQLNEIKFYADGNIKWGGSSFEGWELPLFGGRVGVTEIKLTNEGLNLKAFVTLPPDVFGDVSLYFDQLTLHPDGSITTDVAVPKLDFPLFGFKFSFRNIRFDNQGLSISSGSITLPDFLEYKKISFNNFRIKSDGSFELGGARVDPFTLFGLTFSIDNFSIVENVITFEGGIQLPESFGPGFGGQSIAIEEFKIPLNGDPLTIRANFVHTFDIDIVAGWKIRATNPGVIFENNQFWLSLASAELVFPEWLSQTVKKASITNLKFNTVTAAFDFSNITVEGVNLPVLGFDFYLEKLVISDEWDFTFQGSVTLPSYFPGVLANVKLDVLKFEILKGATIGDIDAKVENLEGSLFDILWLSGVEGKSGAEVGFKMEDGELLLTCSGRITFQSAVFPQGIQGKSVDLIRFALRSKDGKVDIVDFYAKNVTPLSINLFGLVQAKDILFELQKNPAIQPQKPGEDIELSINGTIVLPSIMPGFLKSKDVKIDAFKINMAGDILAFKAGLVITGWQDLFAGIQIGPVPNTYLLTVTMESKTLVYFDIAGQLKFGSSFPEGIAGAVCTVNAFRFNTNGEINNVDVAMEFPTGKKLFGLLELRGLTAQHGATIALKKPPNEDLRIFLEGKIVLPDFLQQAGQPERLITITKFAINVNGTIEEIDGSATLGAIDIFGVLTLQNFVVGLRKQTGSEGLVIWASGNALLPAALPGLGGKTLAIRKLEYTTNTNSFVFDIGLAANELFEFDLFAGVKVRVLSLNVNNGGFSTSGKIILPDVFPAGLRVREILVNAFAMKWDGTLTTIEAGIGNAEFELFGLRMTIKNFYFRTNGISIDEGMVYLPGNLGGLSFGIRSAGFDYNGNFYGSFVLPDFQIPIAGFNIKFEGATFPAGTLGIGFRAVTMVMPPFMLSGEVKLTDVRIDGEGLHIGGGKVKIPDFGIAGGLGFTGMEVEFGTEETNPGEFHSFVRGQGSMTIPGVGTISAKVAFTEVCTDYPWGLKYAEFSWEAYGLGIPIGSTPFFINGISGGLAFGLPDEIPQELRWLFSKGMRIKLGLKMQDATGGRMMKGGFSLWISITNFALAFQGNATFLSGFIYSETVAGISGKGFYARITVRIAIVEGTARIWIWDENGTTYFAGEAVVTIILRTGCICVIDLWLFKIYIPPFDFALASGGARLGTFRNGRSGIAGWVDFLGAKLGAFIPSSGGFEFINIDEYQLYTPDVTASGANSLQSAGLSNGLKGDAAGAPKTAAPIPNSAKVWALDRPHAYRAGTKYNFNANAAKKETPRTDLLQGQMNLRAATTENANITEPGLETLLCAVAYLEGDPSVVLTSPSGKEYGEGSEGVQVQRAEWGMLLGVKTHEQGEWSVRVDNLPDGALVDIRVLGVKEAPQIVVPTPALANELVSGTVVLKGNLTLGGKAGQEVSAGISEEKGSVIGLPVGKAAVQADGSFSVAVDTTRLPDGTYYVFASLDDGVNPPVSGFSPGSLVVKNQQLPFAAVQKIAVAQIANGGVNLSFEDPNGARAAGFAVYKTAEGRETRIVIGNLTKVDLFGFESGKTYRLAVAAYDGSQREGGRSPAISFVYGKTPVVRNAFTLPAKQFSLQVESGGAISGTIAYNVSSPVETGEAYDYLGMRLVEAPAWATISFTRERYPLTQATGTAGYIVSCNGSPAPGVYQAAIELYNLGNPELKATVTVGIEVVYLAPGVSAVQPAEWHTADGAEIEIYGTCFYEGTRVYFDGVETPVAGMTQTYMKLSVPAGMAVGPKTVTVKGPYGAEVSAPVAVIGPDYGVVWYKSRAVIGRGGEDRFYFTIKGRDRFEGSASFTVENAPAGWNAWLVDPSVGEGELGVLVVDAPDAAGPGTFVLTVVSDRGYPQNIDITVIEGTPTPAIASLQPAAGCVGDEITVFGSGFGAQGRLYLGEREIAAAQWESSLIRFRVLEDYADGNLSVETGGARSNTIYFAVREQGFNLYPEESKVTLAPGETRQIRVAVSGAKQTVTLAGVSRTEGLTAVVNPASLLPNGIATLAVHADGALANGLYEVSVRGTAGTVEREKKLVVAVGNAFEIATDRLPGAMEGCGYYAQLEAKNGAEPVRFAVSEGSALPPGLRLSAGGLIDGRPSEIGVYAFSVKATDAGGKTSEKALTISVTENAWGFGYHDEGRTKYNPVSTPATPTAAWTAENAEPGTDLLAGGKRLFVRGAAEVAAYDAETGRKMYAKAESVVDWLYLNNKLFVLDADRELEAWDALYGHLLWKRENVERFTARGDALLAETNGETIILQGRETEGVISGTVRGTIPVTLGAEGFFLAHNGALLRVKGKTIERLDNAQWIKIVEQGSAIADAASDGKNLAVLTGQGTLTLFAEGFQAAGQAETGLALGKVVMTEARLYVYSEYGIACLARNGLAAVWNRALAARDAAGAAERLFVVNGGELAVLNGYDGRVLWTKQEGHGDVVIAGERVYALSLDATVTAYSGSSNSSPPSTEVVTAPEAPDGERGYFITRPSVELKASDPETYVTETWYRIGDGEWTKYAGVFELPEGEYGLSLYSKDSQGLKEPTVVKQFKVDATAPESAMTISGTDIGNGCYGSAVELAFSATDGLSGVERIEYSLDGATWTPVSGTVAFQTEGLYRVSWRAKDFAGNYEAARTVSFAVDTAPPVAWHHVYAEPGLAVVYLGASDAGSGVSRIEYVLSSSGHGRDEPKDKDAILTYAGPIVVTDKGKYTVFYRAVDKAGRISSWKKVTFDVDKAESFADELESALRGGPHGEVVAAKAGERLFEAKGRPDPNNRIKALPAYLEGAYLVRGEYEDKNVFGRDVYDFIAPADLDVYVMKHRDSRADFTGWEPEEKAYPVEPVFYYRGGADIYHKFYGRGERVTIPGAGVQGPGYGNLVFVKYAESNKVKITSPEPGSTLASGDTIFFASYLKDLSPAAYKWEARVGDGEWIFVSDKPLGGYKLPDIEGVTAFSLRLSVTDRDGKSIAATARYEIANRAHVRLINPAPGEALFTHESVELEYRAFDAEGNELRKHSVTFFVMERDTWHRLYGDRLQAPGKEGTLYLKAVIDMGKGKTQEEVFQFEVVKAPRPWWIYFWPHPTGPFCLGHREGRRPDGRHYGFTADFSRRAERFKIKDDNGRESQSGCVRLDGKESFTYQSGRGSFKVCLTVLVEKGRSGYLIVNEKPVKLENPAKEARLFAVETTAVAEAGAIRVSGSADLGLVDMNMERMLPGANASPEAIIKPVKGVHVIGK